MKKIVLWSLLALLVVLVLSMLAAPTVARHYVVDHFPEWVEGAELELDNIDIAWFAGAVRVEGATVRRGDVVESSLDAVEVNIGLWSLLTGHVVIDEVLVEGLQTRASRLENGELLLGGYRLPVADDTSASDGDDSAQKGSGEEVAAEKDAYLKSLIVHRFIFRDGSVSWQDADTSAALTLEAFRIDGAELTLATAEAPMALTMDGLRLDHWRAVAKTAAGASSVHLASLKQSAVDLTLPAGADPVLIAGELLIESLGLEHEGEQDQLALELERFSLSGFDGSQPQKAQDMDLAIALKRFESTRAGTLITLDAGARLKASGALSGTLAAPEASAQLSLENVTLNAPKLGESGETLLNFAALGLKGVDWGENGLKIAQTQLKQFEAMPRQTGERALLALSMLTLEGTSLDLEQNLAIESAVLDGLSADVQLTPERQLDSLTGLKAAMDEAKQDKDGGASRKEADAQQAPTETPAIRIGELRVVGNSHVYLKDNGVIPSYERTLNIEELVIGTLDSGRKDLKTPLKFVANMGEYSRIDLEGEYQIFHPAPSGQLKGKITGVELVPLSPYALDTTGYFIRTGQLNSDIDAVLDQAQLSGTVVLRMNKIKLAPGNESQMARVKQRLSMPLDTALGMIRDKDGDVSLEIPLEGNINSPEFGTGDVMATITSKALTQASVSYLKYAFQPYGAMISVGSWLGKKATAVRLDPLRYEPGETDISDDQRGYLDKVGELMAKREGIRVTLCGVSGERERLALSAGEGTEPVEQQVLVKLATERANVVRSYLVDEHGIATDRLYQCQARFDAGMGDSQSAVFLEI
ncbi:MAG: DUF748 domain-containing protein [Pseudomonadota bacterium]